MRPVWPAACFLHLLLALGTWSGPAAAQKVPGATLSSPEPALSPPANRPITAARQSPQSLRPAPAYTPPGAAAGPAAAGAERDAEARQLANQLPLDPTTANLQARMPADVPGTINRLGMRVPNGNATDLRNQPNTRETVIDALRH